MLVLLLSDPLSECYSVAPDKELSSAVLKEFRKIISNSPKISKYFKLLRSETRCTLNDSYYKPLACSENRLDSRLPVFFIGDEVGALKTNYPIEAMQSGQVVLSEKMGVLISTAYDSLENVMTENIDYAKKVLDDLIDDDTIFALIFEPDNPKDALSDTSIFQANPLALDVEVIKDSVFKKRQKAIEMPSLMTNFLTKHANVFLDGNLLEVYISLDDLRKGKIPHNSYDWRGKEVYLGVDLSQSDDNTAVTMVTYDKELGKYINKAWVFYPENREDDKIKTEKIPYDRFAREGLCYPCGDRIIDYKFVEDFVLNLEKKYGVKIKSITYDRYNAMSSIQKWEDNLPYADMIEQKQHSQYLHTGTKKMREVVLQERFLYEENKLLEINIQNCMLDRDTNRNLYVNKKKSNGKIDIADALINCYCSIVSDGIESESIYETDERDGFIFF